MNPEQKTKVVIVEDDPAISNLYSTKLTMEGFEVKTADNGNDGVDLIKSYKPTVVLLDIMMPDFNGIDFLTQLRRIKEHDVIKVIVMTNIDDPKLKKSLEHLVSDYVIKAETNPAEIVEKIRTLVV